MNSQIYYSFLAGWCADAAGARLEFRKKKFTEQEALNAMHFIGEKTTGIPEGQFTDDSEMEIALLQGLINGKNEEYFPTEKIAEEYIKWYNSNPFDKGNTTRYAFINATNAEDIVNNVAKFNQTSESNGSLMRCLPIAAFCINKPNSIILEVAAIDASLTHCSETIHLITGIYCCILAQILSSRIKSSFSEVNIDNLIEMVKDTIITQDDADSILLTWISEALELSNLSNYDAIKHEGHVKHAFIFFIYFLKNINNYTYERAIVEVLQCGGDTDTNAKIIGNLFGAYYGDCVPKYMSDVVLNFDCTQAPKHFRRPENYGILHGIKLIKDIN